MTVTVTGAAHVRAQLARLVRGLGDLQIVNDAALDLIQATASARAPKRSGRLASSGRVVADNVTGTVTFGSSLAYAAVIHNGWPAHNITANPFVLDAVEATEGARIRLYHNRIRDLTKGI